jgi:hypothetical protein
MKRVMAMARTNETTAKKTLLSVTSLEATAAKLVSMLVEIVLTVCLQALMLQELPMGSCQIP